MIEISLAQGFGVGGRPLLRNLRFGNGTIIRPVRFCNRRRGRLFAAAQEGNECRDS
jgi:hypothetical protein